MARVFLALALLLATILTAAPARAEECGPSCPVCSGNSGAGAVLGRGTLLASGLLIPTGADERGVLNLRYGVLDWLDVGVGYTVDSHRPLWSVRAQAVRERPDGWLPSLVVGTGSVRIGGSDQSVYAQISKGFALPLRLRLQLTGGSAILVPEVDRVYGLAGATLQFQDRVSLFVSYDGSNLHEGASLTPVEWLSISAILVESHDLAAAVTLRWRLGRERGHEEHHDEHATAGPGPAGLLPTAVFPRDGRAAGAGLR